MNRTHDQNGLLNKRPACPISEESSLWWISFNKADARSVARVVVWAVRVIEWRLEKCTDRLERALLDPSRRL